MTFAHPQYLVETEWLETHLTDPDLRVLDCTILSDVDRRWPYLESGREAWAQGHIPGSGFVDLMSELSDPESPLPFMMPPATQFAEVMSRYGVGDGTRVVLYEVSRNMWTSMWAARVWWMLRAFGFDQAAILNGGLHKWTMEGRPISTEPCAYPPARFTARLRPELIADKREVLAAIGDSGRCLINALTAEEHAGQLILYGEAVKPMAQELGLTVRLQFLVITKAKTPKIELYPVPTDPDRVKRTQKVFERVFQDMQTGVVYPSPSVMNCSTCPFQQACAKWHRG